MRARGADFSSAQSLAEVEHAIGEGISFAFVKATQGVDYVNPLAQKQIGALRTGGVHVVGRYHFLTADHDGAAQWDHFEASLRMTLGRAWSGPVAVDYEPLHGVLPPAHIAQAFIRRGQQRGYKVGRYSNGNEFHRFPSLGEDWRWVAWWAPSPPPFRWDVWQFTSTGGRQDWNLFNGTPAQLSEWAAKVDRPLPSPPLRWWLHDDFAKQARGPFRLAVLAPAVVRYLLAHPKTGLLRLERK